MFTNIHTHIHNKAQYFDLYWTLFMIIKISTGPSIQSGLIYVTQL